LPFYQPIHDEDKPKTAASLKPIGSNRRRYVRIVDTRWRHFVAPRHVQNARWIKEGSDIRQIPNIPWGTVFIDDLLRTDAGVARFNRVQVSLDDCSELAGQSRIHFLHKKFVPRGCHRLGSLTVAVRGGKYF